MGSREKKVLCSAVAVLIIAMIYPPVSDTVVYRKSSGVSSIRSAVHYEFLFTKSAKEIYYPRLAIEYLIVTLATAGVLIALSSKHRQCDDRTAQQISDLTEAKKQLKGKVARASWENENLRERQVLLETRIEQLSAGLAKQKGAEKQADKPISEIKLPENKKPENSPRPDQNV